MHKTNRRNFIEMSGKFTLAAGAMALTSGFTGNHGPMGNIFVHHVFFWLKESGNAQHIERFAKALEELVTIGAIKFHHVGKPADTSREIIDSSYQFSLLTIFDDKAAHDVYQVHPVHDAFRKTAGELCSKVVVYDSISGSL